MDDDGDDVNNEIGLAKYIVSEDWLMESKKLGKWANETKFIICDEAAEEQYGFSLQKAIFSSQQSKLLANYQFILTDNIKPTPMEFKQMIEYSGGQVRYQYLLLLLFILVFIYL